ncbi:hypothetical protein M427DRAFT_40243 [Gonapodya prolifera JEL478]|uniref:Uncharacterized protein n=1 Tax=Gonapodya prolifera (strain JEL478) TaxID=1344416 RepID=A0A139B022_GONPJ|nr:hypothetical protein M427DRAFT_40243 [Gonapodya prolifera JEL478]|eukprot:KXS22329.1 hypothetical protein M427DRAFT_40243 [Gonapodya prolifera JEL478]
MGDGRIQFHQQVLVEGFRRVITDGAIWTTVDNGEGSSAIVYCNIHKEGEPINKPLSVVIDTNLNGNTTLLEFINTCFLESPTPSVQAYNLASVSPMVRLNVSEFKGTPILLWGIPQKGHPPVVKQDKFEDNATTPSKPSDEKHLLKLETLLPTVSSVSFVVIFCQKNDVLLQGMFQTGSERNHQDQACEAKETARIPQSLACWSTPPGSSGVHWWSKGMAQALHLLRSTRECDNCESKDDDHNPTDSESVEANAD